MSEQKRRRPTHDTQHTNTPTYTPHTSSPPYSCEHSSPATVTLPEKQEVKEKPKEALLEMYSWLSSNVIQTIGDNINHGINNAVTALENFDEEFNNENAQNGVDEEEEEREDIEIYKKLLEESQMQIVELSKQYRVTLFEKDAELLFWKNKMTKTKRRCETDEITTLDSNTLEEKEGTGGEGEGEEEEEEEKEFKEKISQAITSAEFVALQTTLREMEEKMKSLLREKNEFVVKLRQYPELLNELGELKAQLRNQNENESKKSDEIDDLVQEYSKLAAESEKQKSSDSLRIKELELENEIMTTKLQALEHSIAELADRANPLPGRLFSFNFTL